MSVDARGERFCDNCGHLIAKATRIFKGQEYCNTCYQREFPPVPCTRCGKTARPHRYSQGPALCMGCERDKRKCIRCTAALPRAALLTAAGAACAVCARHFLTPRPCSRCNVPSTRLGRDPESGSDDLVCESCLRRADHATCSGCRRYRPVASRNVAGKALCAPCTACPGSGHTCATCGAFVPGDGEGKCRNCTERLRLRAATTTLAAGLEQHWARDLFEAFTESLARRKELGTGMVQRVQRSFEFFERLDRTFTDPKQLTRTALVESFGASVLRSYLLASQFVAGRGADDEGAVQQRIEQARIDAKLKRTAGRSYGWILASYSRYLQRKEIVERTARLYLHSAQAFCEVALTPLAQPWAQSTLVAYLKTHPGHAASLTSFVSFCREQLAWGVEMPPRKLWLDRNRRTRRAIERLGKLLQQIEGRALHEVDPQLLGRILSTALGLASSRLEAAADQAEVMVGGTTGQISISGLEPISAGSRIAAITRAWLGQRANAKR